MKSKKSDIAIEKRKIIFQYICVLLFSLLLGGAFAFALKDGTVLSFGEQIRSHFAASLPKDKLIRNILISALRYALPELVCIVAAFCFSFSVFNYLASDAVIFYEGFSVAFSAVVLYRCVTVYELISTSRLVWFVGFRVAFLIFFMSYLYGLAVHSLELKEFNSVHRVNIRFKPLVFLVIYTLAGLGTAMVLSGIYCVVVFIL